MKKVLLFSIVTTFIFSCVNYFFVGTVHATVGGPSYIHSFKYNPSDESVYYIREDHGGRGCPPELIKISLETGQQQVVFSCDQGEELRGFEDYSSYPVVAHINKLTEGFKDLTPINLKDNNFSIDVSFVKDEKFDYIDEIKGKTFNGAIYQDNNKVKDITINGCNSDQPFVFEGYAIPGFDKKIVLLLSTKGDCFEGGYIAENLYVIGGVDNLDKNIYTNSYKGNSALIPYEGTLVVFESDQLENIVDSGSSNDPVSPIISNTKNLSPNSIFLVAIISILFGILLGIVIKRK